MAEANPTEFESLLKALSEANVRFIIVGGVAATIHGAVRLTQDLDIVYERTAENFERLVDVLQSHGPYLRGAPPGLPFRWDAETISAGLNFTLSTDHRRKQSCVARYIDSNRFGSVHREVTNASVISCGEVRT